MKILHTSDWHLGQRFMGKSRKEEHQFFLSWLREIIEKENIDLLIIAGDIFDTGNPPNYALELYYNFLKELHTFSNLYVIIIAGNHDSITTLKASKQLLELMNIFVITSGNTLENELISIYKKNELIAVVCAVPFLRDTVVRESLSGETFHQKELALNEGIAKHYKNLYEEAKKRVGDLDIPLIATGHLTTLGSKKSESERDIYIGKSAAIQSDFLANYFDYVALGHLHTNQQVGKSHVYYSGSPIALSFSEGTQIKKVNIVQTNGKKISVKHKEIPALRKLVLLQGESVTLQKELHALQGQDVWCQIDLQDENPVAANQVLRALAKELDITLLAIKIEKPLHTLHAKEALVMRLEELTPQEVFAQKVSKESLQDPVLRDLLVARFEAIVQKV